MFLDMSEFHVDYKELTVRIVNKYKGWKYQMGKDADRWMERFLGFNPKLAVLETLPDTTTLLCQAISSIATHTFTISLTAL